MFKTRKFLALGLVLILALTLLAGCGKKEVPKTEPAPEPPKPPAFKVGMVTDIGGVNDQSFNASAFRGLKKAESDLSAEIKVVESSKLEDYEPNLSSLVDQKTDISWSIGFLMTEAAANIAKKYPDAKFGIIDSVVEAPNVASVVFKEEEGSFLVGMIAAKMTKTGKVGFMGGMQVPIIEKFEAGYRAGVAAVDPKIKVVVAYTGSFNNQAKGKEVALAQYGKGVDIIFSAAGADGLGAIEAAKEKKLFAIGVDSDQRHLAPDSVITSMMKYVDNAVFTVTKMAKEGNFPGGKVTVLGLKENGVGPAPGEGSALVPADVMALVETWKKAIIDGKFVVPTAIAEYETFKKDVLPKLEIK